MCALRRAHRLPRGFQHALSGSCMTATLSIYWKVADFFILTFGGWLIVGALMYLMRKHVGVSTTGCWGRLELWLGSVERIAATTMFVYGVSYLPAFIGAWIAFKLAANWRRRKASEEVCKGTLMALIGSIFSCALAIIVGAFINPSAIANFVNLRRLTHDFTLSRDRCVTPSCAAWWSPGHLSRRLRA
jgi:hypothetical protein